MAPAAGANPDAPKISARAWALIDERSGDVLAARGRDLSAPIASATKMMTALVASRALRPGELVGAPIYDASPGESLMGLRAGEIVTVRELLYGLLLASGNDAAVTLAGAASGSQEAFVARMNATAERLGLTATSFVDPIGLSPGNVSSAADLVQLASSLRSDPLLAKIVATPRITLGGESRRRRLVNSNALLLRNPWLDGVKTGSTVEAGFVLVSSAQRKGVPLVAAVLGTQSERARDEASLELLRYGASLYEPMRVVTEAERLASTNLGETHLPLLAGSGVTVTVRADQHVTVRLDAPALVDVSVNRGQRIGSGEVLVDGERAARFDLVAARAVDGPSVLDRIDAEVPGGRTALLATAGVTLALLAAVLMRVVVRRRRPR